MGFVLTSGKEETSIFRAVANWVGLRSLRTWSAFTQHRRSSSAFCLICDITPRNFVQNKRRNPAREYLFMERRAVFAI